MNTIEADEGMTLGEERKRPRTEFWGIFLGNIKTHGNSQVPFVGKSEIKMRMVSIN